ncbi:endonuclease/exonuclease/phosphatase family protein [Streptomyces sp. Je 1-369]|uniref:endonuclease/exonuclease/phosphatase family protein n=1 Tax=Streptomyces sp. Je 1-369 TaxID=2966192 RepID=UPI002285FD57|nr:endonuclease/exonuclease/phosphatase family protein [Streptomyces sp. Je 1-369]WAL99621.1 endonuclease/exonuclease/phosphatase family protein [Streptomyces sp. Je 1-369]
MRIALPAVLLTALLVFPGVLPNTPGHLGSLVETALPWFGLGIPLLLAAAAVRRSLKGLAFALVPTVAWAALFGPGLVSLPQPSPGRTDFQVLTLNVGGDRTAPRDVARDILAADADVVALEKVPNGAMKTYEQELHAIYPHRATGDTLGLWSRYPLHGVEKLDLGGAWPHAVRAVARTPVGDTAVYAVRLPSVRVTVREGFAVRRRDASAARLAERVARDPARRVVVLGDLNGSLRDRGLAPLTHRLRPAGGGSGHGPGFTWPAAFPVVRLDHVLLRGLTPTGTTVLPDLGSDHRPVLTGLRSFR